MQARHAMIDNTTTPIPASKKGSCKMSIHCFTGIYIMSLISLSALERGWGWWRGESTQTPNYAHAL